MGKKILIVDDEPEQIEFASTLLEENGYIPISAMNGVEGMEKVKAEKPDLVLLDILMPKEVGSECIRISSMTRRPRRFPLSSLRALLKVRISRTS